MRLLLIPTFLLLVLGNNVAAAAVADLNQDYRDYLKTAVHATDLTQFDRELGIENDPKAKAFYRELDKLGFPGCEHEKYDLYLQSKEMDNYCSAMHKADSFRTARCGHLLFLYYRTFADHGLKRAASRTEKRLRDIVNSLLRDPKGDGYYMYALSYSLMNYASTIRNRALFSLSVKLVIKSIKQGIYCKDAEEARLYWRIVGSIESENAMSGEINCSATDSFDASVKDITEIIAHASGIFEQHVLLELWFRALFTIKRCGSIPFDDLVSTVSDGIHQDQLTWYCAMMRKCILEPEERERKVKYSEYICSHSEITESR